MSDMIPPQKQTEVKIVRQAIVRKETLPVLTLGQQLENLKKGIVKAETKLDEKGPAPGPGPKPTEK